MKNNKNPYYIYKLLSINRIGPVLINKIFSNRENSLFNYDEKLELDLFKSILSNYLSSLQMQEFSSKDTNLENYIKELSDKKSKFITILNKNYPKLLLQALKNSAPPILSYIGNINLLKSVGVGFCGSRKASQKGLNATRDLVEQLVENKIVIISGYASGVDNEAHHTALVNNGSTIIVLPTGLLNFKIKKSLEQIWDWDRVLVLSEFIPNTQWSVSRAMQRNKTIIGLSKAMVLIESSRSGGSMDAGIRTLEMNRKLYTPIYQNMPEFAVGNKILLKKGAFRILKHESTGKANTANLINHIGL